MALFRGRRNRDDQFIGTGEKDRFIFDPRDLGSGDIIAGGDGRAIDLLKFRAAGAITAASLMGVSGIERIELADGVNSIVLTDELAASIDGGWLTVVGGAGPDLIDASALAPSRVARINGGAGDDLILGGHYYQTIDGGLGADRITTIGSAQVFYDPDDASVATVRGQLLLRGAAIIDLTRTDDQSLGDAAVLTGFATASADGSRTGVTLTGGMDHRLTGGAGSDILTGAGWMRGGRGADVMIGGAHATRFALYDGEFARGEVIQGNGDSDALIVIGTNDIRRGTVTGIDRIAFYDSPFIISEGGVSGGHLIARSGQLTDVVTIEGGAGSLDIRMEPGVALLPNWVGREASRPFIDVTGTNGADTIRAQPFRDVWGGGGDDRIYASRSIWGEDGDDIILVPSKWNPDPVRTIDGGPGSDTLMLTGYPGQTTMIDLANVDDQLVLVDVAGARLPTVASNFEHVDLSEAPNYNTILSVAGDDGDNVLITGGRFTDPGGSTIDGRGGDDILVGGAGEDRIDGGDGDDRITGGLRPDILSGGAGADVFVWNDREEGGDKILDFEAIDRLAFDAAAFGKDSLDVRRESATRVNDLSDVDLLIYQRRTTNIEFELINMLARSTGLEENAGLFIVGRDNGGTKLFHVGGSYPSLKLIATLSYDVSFDEIQLDTLMLI